MSDLAKKENNILLFKKGDKEIFILGTIHYQHLIKNTQYSLAHVQSVIKTVKPDKLLIETRPNTLRKYNAIDGQIEMIFAKCYAEEQGIAVEGVDWWAVVKTKDIQDVLELERDDKIFDNILSVAENYNKVLILMGASHRERMPDRFTKKGYTQVKIYDIPSYFNAVDSPFSYPKKMSD